jgi:tetratricopeptide (TPR) repeat protein
MTDNSKTEEFLQKLTPCIQRGEPEACAEEAALLAGDMGMGAAQLLDLSSTAGASGRHDLAYVLALAAAQGLEGIERAEAYYNAGVAAQFLKNVQKAEKQYQDAIEANPNYAEAHGAYGLLLIELDRREDAWKETELASTMFKEAGRGSESHLAKAWFYQRCSEKYLEAKKYQESSEDIHNSGEEYLKASETVEGEIKYAFELKGNVYKAQSFIRKEHRTNQELVSDLKSASEFYKKASVCHAGGTEETCGACYSVMDVFSQVLTALEEVVHNKRPFIRKEEWNGKLDKSNDVYIKKGSEKGVALVASLKQLIKCVDELAYYTARRSSLQKKRLKECYKTLEDVSSKIEGGLRNIIDPANDIIKNCARKMGIPMPEEKVIDEPPPARNIKKLVEYLVIILTAIGSIIAVLQFLKQDTSALEFIKSLFP